MAKFFQHPKNVYTLDGMPATLKLPSEVGPEGKTAVIGVSVTSAFAQDERNIEYTVELCLKAGFSRVIFLIADGNLLVNSLKATPLSYVQRVTGDLFPSELLDEGADPAEPESGADDSMAKIADKIGQNWRARFLSDTQGYIKRLREKRVPFEVLHWKDVEREGASGLTFKRAYEAVETCFRQGAAVSHSLLGSDADTRRNPETNGLDFKFYTAVERFSKDYLKRRAVDADESEKSGVIESFRYDASRNYILTELAGLGKLACDGSLNAFVYPGRCPPAMYHLMQNMSKFFPLHYSAEKRFFWVTLSLNMGAAANSRKTKASDAVTLVSDQNMRELMEKVDRLQRQLEEIRSKQRCGEFSKVLVPVLFAILILAAIAVALYYWPLRGEGVLSDAASSSAFRP